MVLFPRRLVSVSRINIKSKRNIHRGHRESQQRNAYPRYFPGISGARGSSSHAVSRPTYTKYCYGRRFVANNAFDPACNKNANMCFGVIMELGV